MAYYDDFMARVSQEGSNPADYLKSMAKESIAQNIKDSVSYYQVTLERPLSPAELIDVQIVDDSQTKDERILTTLYETPISSGNIITWKGAKWLVIHFDEMSEIYKRCRIRKCLTTIKWLNADGLVKEAYFTLSAPTGTNFGVQDGRIIDMGSERRQILIQSNVDTKLLTKSRRFIFDARCWRTTAIDKLTDGLIGLTLDEDQINPATDNMVDRIADFYRNEANYAITITNGNSFSIQPNQTLQLNAQVTNNSTVVTQPVTWSVSDETIAAVDETGLLTGISSGTVTVTVRLDIDSLISATASVTVEEVIVDTYSINITNTTTAPTQIKKDQSKTYNAEVYNSAILITDGSQPVTWQLFNDDQVSATTIASITSQTGTSCVVKNNAAISGFVQLRAMLTSDSTVITWFRIEMIPLF